MGERSLDYWIDFALKHRGIDSTIAECNEYLAEFTDVRMVDKDLLEIFRNELRRTGHLRTKAEHRAVEVSRLLEEPEGRRALSVALRRLNGNDLREVLGFDDGQ